MKLSVITINKDNASGLSDTVASILAQTNQSFEYIIVDGASNDGSLDVNNGFMAKHDDALSVKWVSEPDNGIYNAMNKGIMMASGEYLLFLNSGDSFASDDVVEKIMAEKFSADIVIARCNLYKGDVLDWTYIPQENYTFGTLFIYGIAHQAAFISKKLFEKYGLYDETYKYNGDIEFWYRTIIDNKASTQPFDFLVTKYMMGGLSDVLKDDPRFKEENKRILSNPAYEKFICDYEEMKIKYKWIEENKVVDKYPLVIRFLNWFERIKRRK